MMDNLAFWPSFFKMLSALAVVLGLLVGAMYFFRRILQQPTAGGQDTGAINVVAARYLGPKSSIMLVEVLGKFIVIGLANNQMSHLATIRDPEALERFKSSANPEKKLPTLVDYIKNHKVTRDIAHLLRKGGPWKGRKR
jgi:flagellar protein FliO/FliZ